MAIAANFKHCQSNLATDALVPNQSDRITQFWYFFTNAGFLGAIAAYTEAFTILQSLRTDLVMTSSQLRFSFRDTIEPFYRELVGWAKFCPPYP